jgi:hypothetical protein
MVKEPARFDGSTFSFTDEEGAYGDYHFIDLAQ